MHIINNYMDGKTVKISSGHHFRWLLEGCTKVRLSSIEEVDFTVSRPKSGVGLKSHFKTFSNVNRFRDLLEQNTMKWRH